MSISLISLGKGVECYLFCPKKGRGQFCPLIVYTFYFVDSIYWHFIYIYIYIYLYKFIMSFITQLELFDVFNKNIFIEFFGFFFFDKPIKKCFLFFYSIVQCERET